MVARMSERQQIVLLICVVGGFVCVYVSVCVGGGCEGKKKISFSLTTDDIFGGTSKTSQGGRGRSVQATDRVLHLLALLLRKIQASLWRRAIVCVVYASESGLYFLFCTNK